MNELLLVFSALFALLVGLILAVGGIRRLSSVHPVAFVLVLALACLQGALPFLTTKFGLAAFVIANVLAGAFSTTLIKKILR